MTVVAVEGRALLAAVHRVVRAVDIEHEPRWRLARSGPSFLDRSLVWIPAWQRRHRDGQEEAAVHVGV